MAPSFTISPIHRALTDFQDAVTQGADIAAIARGPIDDSLTIAMNRDWILDAASADLNADADFEWLRVGLLWATAYNMAFRKWARAAVSAARDLTDDQIGEHHRWVAEFGSMTAVCDCYTAMLPDDERRCAARARIAATLLRIGT